MKCSHPEEMRISFLFESSEVFGFALPRCDPFIYSLRPSQRQELAHRGCFIHKIINILAIPPQQQQEKPSPAQTLDAA